MNTLLLAVLLFADPNTKAPDLKVPDATIAKLQEISKDIQSLNVQVALYQERVKTAQLLQEKFERILSEASGKFDAEFQAAFAAKGLSQDEYRMDGAARSFVKLTPDEQAKMKAAKAQAQAQAQK